MKAIATSDVVREPRQARSRATLERVLDATEELLADRTLEDITLTDVLKRSRVSVGAFYARFASKDALVPCLYDRYDRRLTASAGRVLDPGRWRGVGLGDRVHRLVRYCATLYRRDRGLMRALILYARTYPDAVDAMQRARRTDLYRAAAALLLECRDEMTHPRLEHAINLGLLMTLSTLREKILLASSPHARSFEVSDGDLSRELSRAFLAYVGYDRKDST